MADRVFCHLGALAMTSETSIFINTTHQPFTCGFYDEYMCILFARNKRGVDEESAKIEWDARDESI